MATTTVVPDTVTLVITLHVPLGRQAVNPVNRPVAPVAQEAALRSWLHDYPTQTQRPKAQQLTVAQRNFYLQKGWGG